MSSTKFVFLDRSEKQDGRPGLWFAETYSTSPLKLLQGIQWFYFSSETAKQNSTKLDRKQDLNVICEVNIFGTSEIKDGHPGLSFAWTFSTSLKLLNRILNETWQEARSWWPLPSFWPIRNPRWLIWKTRWPPWPLIGWDIFSFFSEPAEQNSTKLDRKQDLNVLYH